MRQMFPSLPRDTVYMERAVFEALMLAISKTPDEKMQNRLLGLLSFSEVYVPASGVPGLAAEMVPHLEDYANGLARLGKGAVFYVNPGLRKFIANINQLQHARVLLFDYGDSADDYFKSIARFPGHFRSYPFGSNVYAYVSRQDWTADVPWTTFAREAIAGGWSIDFFGSQNALVAGTAYAEKGLEKIARRYTHLKAILLRRGTPSPLTLPNRKSEPLFGLNNNLSPQERTKARTLLEQMLESLRGPAKPAGAPQARIRHERTLLASS
jgi:SAM-dependent MidA family methyltransferase